jgi:hypothetical protein
MASILLRPRRDSQESRSSFRSVDVGILGLTWQTKIRRLAKDAFRSRRDSQESRSSGHRSHQQNSRDSQEALRKRPSGQAAIRKPARSGSQETRAAGTRKSRRRCAWAEQNNSGPSAYIRARRSRRPWQTLSPGAARVGRQPGFGRLGWRAAKGLRRNRRVLQVSYQAT